jgi:hypothetical protein
MTTTYSPESATYAWSESDRQYGRPYVAPPARPGWYDGYGPIDRPNYMATPAPVVQSSNSTTLRKGAMAAALLTAVVGGALLGTFVLANSESAPDPSVYVVPETSGAPAAPLPPAATPPAPNTIVVPSPGPTVVVPPANRGPAPAAVPAPPAPKPVAPKPANVPPPPPPAPAAPPQVRIEGIPIPIPMPAQIPASPGQNNQGQQQQGQDEQGQGQGQDECTMVPDLPYCKKTPDPNTGGTSGGGTTPTGGAGGTDPSGGGFDPATPKDQAEQSQLELPPAATEPAFDPDKLFPKPPCILGVCP